MLRRAFVFATATAVLTPAFLAAAAPGKAAPVLDTFQGKVAAYSGGNLMVLARNGDNVSFRIADDCKITLDGQPAQPDMLAVGLFVLISAADEGTAHIAKTIVARSRE